MDKEIFYVGYNTQYGNPNEVLEFPSCNSKMQYIIEKLEELEFNISIFSLGQSVSWHTQKTIKYSFKKKVTYVGTVPNKGILKALSKVFLVYQILLLVLLKVPRNGKIIVYHSTYLPFLFSLIKKIKKIEVIYEVEEIYAAAWRKDETCIKRELDSLKFADKYILVNDILPIKMNISKPYIVCYGSYKCISKNSIDQKKNNVEIVYAGVIGNEMSDVYIAVDAMQYLPSNYVLKIVGYGSDYDLEKFKLYIKNFKNVIYDGLLKGEKYSEYLLSCDIGLCPRRLDNNLSDYTFPSKVLVYLGHSLHTITTKIDCIVNSEVKDIVSFVDELNAYNLAEAILHIDLLKNNSQDKLIELDENFRMNLKDLLL